jgi:hypothetical protein
MRRYILMRFPAITSLCHQFLQMPRNTSWTWTKGSAASSTTIPDKSPEPRYRRHGSDNYPLLATSIMTRRACNGVVGPWDHMCGPSRRGREDS